MLEHWIWLSRRTGMNDFHRAGLLQAFSSAENVYNAGEQELAQMGDIQADAMHSLLDKNLEETKDILSACLEKSIGVIPMDSPDYPPNLKEISDPPIVLYQAGHMPDLWDRPVIGVIGTRHPSAYGESVAWKIGYALGSGGGIVVSGMAMGVDGIAMSGALASGASVIGVLGCGADVVYPKSNAELFAETRVRGCILSEYPPGTPAAKWTFPRRNRIISGLSRGIAVVEAPEKSGSLITVNYALDQGRDVFVVPGNVDMPGFQGSNRLLQDGATAISCGWDILESYVGQYPGVIHRPEETTIVSTTKSRKSKHIPPESKKSIDKPFAGEYSVRANVFTGLSPDEQTIVHCLTAGERLVDDVIAESGMDTGRVLALMTMLEIKGIVIRRPGRRAALKSQI